MKKKFNFIITIFLAVCTIGSVAAQRYGNRQSIGVNRGGRTSYAAAHSARNAVTYRSGNYNSVPMVSRGGRGAYNTYRGGGYNSAPMAYRGNRGVYASRGYGAGRAIVPWGAAHRYGYNRAVYFPAYGLYYDPYRCGYTYWSGGRWLFSSVLPSFLAGIDLAAAEMAYANSIPQAAYYPNDGYYDDGGYYNNYAAPMPAAPGVGIDIHIGL